MSSIKKLEKILEYAINNESEKASQLFKSYIIENAARIHQKLVEEDEDIADMDREVEHDDMGEDFADEIAADKDELETEEMFGEDEDEISHEDAVDELGDEMEVSDDFDADEFDSEDFDLEDAMSDIDVLGDELEDLNSKFDKLSAEFEKIKADEEVEAEDKEEDEVESKDDEDFDFNDEDEYEDGLEESFDLESVKVDSSDKAPGSDIKGAVPAPKDRLDRLGGKPVKTIDKGHKGFEPEVKKVEKISKHTNVVNGKGSSAFSKVSVDMKDKAPGAGHSPAMPKK